MGERGRGRRDEREGMGERGWERGRKGENTVRGFRTRQKGITQKALLAAALDPRTKTLNGVPAAAVDNVAVLPDGDDDEHGNGIFDGLYDGVDDSFDGGDQEETANMLDFELKRYKAVLPLRMLIRSPVKANTMIHSDPLKWWCEQEHNYSRVAGLARRYLCIPATSAPAERAFSTAGHIVDDARSRLLPENAAALVFKKIAWPLTDLLEQEAEN
jgi:hypothetical protein